MIYMYSLCKTMNRDRCRFSLGFSLCPFTSCRELVSRYFFMLTGLSLLTQNIIFWPVWGMFQVTWGQIVSPTNWKHNLNITQWTPTKQIITENKVRWYSQAVDIRHRYYCLNKMSQSILQNYSPISGSVYTCKFGVVVTRISGWFMD